MSTKAIVHFGQTEKNGRYRVQSRIYIHGDGYPDGEHGMLAVLRRFFEESVRQSEGRMYGPRFHDPTLLGARFVVFMAREAARRAVPRYYKRPADEVDAELAAHPLVFGTVRVLVRDRDGGDAAYIYRVDSARVESNGFPLVTYR